MSSFLKTVTLDRKSGVEVKIIKKLALLPDFIKIPIPGPSGRTFFRRLPPDLTYNK